MPKLPYLNDYPNKFKPILTRIGKGINNGLPPFEIDEETATEMQNLDSRYYPVLNVRAPRSADISALTDIRHIGYRQNDYITIVSGTTWQYWDGNAWQVISATLTNKPYADSVDFDNVTVLVNGQDNIYWDGTTSGIVPTMPDGDFLTVHKNRLYLASKANQILYFSALNKYDDWTTVDDAGAITMETRDAETASGLTTYADRVIYFKEHSMHELYGSGPANFQMQTISDKIGCISDRTIREVKGQLFWLAYEGIYIYSGGVVPQLISFPVQGYINRINLTYKEKACAGTDGERYYINLPIDNDSKILLVYDTRFNVWHVEDDIDLVEFVEFGNDLYGTTVLQPYKMVDKTATEEIDWYWISKPYDNQLLSAKKHLHRLYLLLDLPIDSTLQCAISIEAEGTNFTIAKTFTAGNTINMQLIDIPLTVAQNVQWFRIKFSGTGPCTIHRLEMHYRANANTY